MKELICINIGQAGVQISTAMWELFCLEHGITVNGQMTPDNDQSCTSIFMEGSNYLYNPRCLMIDLEPTVLDEIRTGVYRQLFSPSQMITGLEDSSSNFARGHYTIGKIYLEEFLDSLRKMINQCDSLQGFMIVQSLGGGCGSGFSSLAIDQMCIGYPKVTKMQFSVLPSRHIASAIVEPYNFILSSKSSIETVDLSFQHDNQSLWAIIQNKLNLKNPTFTIVNRILAQVFSSLTVSIRYENALNNDLCQIATNIIPFPRLHYLLNFYSPICNVNKGRHFISTTTEITKDVFDPDSKLLDCDFLGEKFISCCLQYRGNISPLQVNQALFEIKKVESIKFVDWCPTGFKIGINKCPSIIPKSCEMFSTDCSVLLMSNNTSFHKKLSQMISKFDLLFKKKSFVHWFVGEGMEEGEFDDAKNELVFLEEDYRCLAYDDDETQDKESTCKIKENSRLVKENQTSLEIDFGSYPRNSRNGDQKEENQNIEQDEINKKYKKEHEDITKRDDEMEKREGTELKTKKDKETKIMSKMKASVKKSIKGSIKTNSTNDGDDDDDDDDDDEDDDDDDSDDDGNVDHASGKDVNKAINKIEADISDSVLKLVMSSNLYFPERINDSKSTLLSPEDDNPINKMMKIFSTDSQSSQIEISPL